MTKKPFILLLLAVLALCVCTTTAQSDSAKHRKITFKSYKLSNGLRVLLAPDASESKVAVNLSFDAGSRRENREQAGLAELIQSILLQNSSQTGFEVDGVVNQERASYFSEFSADRLDSALSLFARQMSLPNLNQTQIDAQRNAWQNDCGKLDESRFGRVQETLLELIYQDSAFKYGAICSLPNLNHLSPEKSKSFFSKFYVPNNAVLVIVGNFEQNEAKNLIAKHFGSISRRNVASATDFDNRQFSLERRKVLAGSRTTFMAAYLTVPSNHPDWYALNILADIIGQGEESRFYKALVAQKFASSVPEGVAESRGQSLFRIGVALMPEVNIENVEAIIDAEIARLQSDGVTQTEMETARLQERQYSAEQLGTTLGRASFLARSTLYYNDPNRINSELKRILAVTAQDVRRVAKKYLVKTNRAVAIVQMSGKM